jgi:hypothetical protein
MRRGAKRSELSNVRNERVSRRALSVIPITPFIRWRASTRSWARTTRPLHGWIERYAPGFAAGRSFELTPLSATCVDCPRFKTILPRSRRTAARFVFRRFEPANHRPSRFRRASLGKRAKLMGLRAPRENSSGSSAGTYLQTSDWLRSFPKKGEFLWRTSRLRTRLLSPLT